MDVINQLERKLNRVRVSERPKILHGVYRQFAVSRRGRRTNGEFRNLTEKDSNVNLNFMCYLIDQLHQYGMPNHADHVYRTLMGELECVYDILSNNTIRIVMDTENRYGPDYVLNSPKYLSDIVKVDENLMGKGWNHYVFGGTIENLRKANFPRTNIDGIKILLVSPEAKYHKGDLVTRLPHNTFHICTPYSLKKAMEPSTIL